MKIDIKAAILVVVTALLAIIVYVEGSEYLELRHQIRTQRQEIQKSVAENTEAVSRLLKYDNDDVNITYKEFFDRGEERLKKISDASIPVGISKLPEDEKKNVKAYLDELETLLRLEVTRYRKQLSASTAFDSFNDAAADLRASGYYGYDFAKKRFDKSAEEAKRALSEADEADEDYLNNAVKFKKTLSVIRPALKEYDLIDDAILTKAIDKHKKTKK